jgi:lipopolysaccharide transport system permease protein
MTVLEPTRGWARLDLVELWSYRDLLAIFIWRDLKVRYKQTAVGVGWVVLQPLASMALLTLVFGRLDAIARPGVPYSLFALSGLVLWQFFARALSDASTSLVVNERIITKAYFPRILVPAAVVLAALVDLGIASVVLVAMLALHGVAPTGALLAAPPALVVLLMAALGTALWLSALDVEYRDVRHTLPFLAQLWFFATPVVYSSDVVPAPWRTLYAVNSLVALAPPGWPRRRAGVARAKAVRRSQTSSGSRRSNTWQPSTRRSRATAPSASGARSPRMPLVLAGNRYADRAILIGIENRSLE